MSTKLAIFDFDGTLADTYPVFIDSINTLAVKHRFRQVDAVDVPKLRGLSAAQVLAELQLPLRRLPAVTVDFRGIMRERIGEIKPFPGVPNALRTLAEDPHVALAIATSNSADIVEAVLGSSLLGCFVAVECGASIFGKSRRLRRILASTRTSRDEAMYIGDEIRDAHAAKRVGIAFSAVAWGYTQSGALLGLNIARMFQTPGDLLDLSTRHAR